MGERDKRSSRREERWHSSKDDKHQDKKYYERRNRSRSPSRRKRRERRNSSDSESGEQSRSKSRDRSKKLAKKIEKHLKKHSRSQASGYRDEDNPFGDSNLSQRFVWGKKIEKDLEAGASIKEYSASAHSRRDKERYNEIEKIKRKREEREAERAAIAEELEILQRERARAEAVELEKQEDMFHLEQAKIRAQQRLAAGRPKAIDIITNNLFLLDGFDKTAEDPSVFISGLTLYQLEELAGDIKEYSRLDAVNKDHDEFWISLSKVTQYALVQARKQDMIAKAAAEGVPLEEGQIPTEAGWHPSLESDIAQMLEGKSLFDLRSLENGIVNQLEHGDAADPDYWHSVLRRLELYKAKAMLREFHESVVERELAKMKEGIAVQMATVTNAERREQAKEEAIRSEAEAQQQPDTTEMEAMTDQAVVHEEKDSIREREKDHLNISSRLTEAIEPQEWDLMGDEERALCVGDGSMSPRPVDESFTLGKNIISDQEDIKQIQLLRNRALSENECPFPTTHADLGLGLKKPSVTFAEELCRKATRIEAAPDPSVIEQSNTLIEHMKKASMTSNEPEERRLKAIAAQTMGQDKEGDASAEFGTEVNLESRMYRWHEMYKPRKPKYFNKVHTTFFWTKYNKAHYDRDNPPPKVVSGYKFNIFYPDLIDPSKTPTYSIEKDSESSDDSTCILRFSAGAPYEDIAFRIINKRWNTDSKSGFRCVFDRGILQLYFRFITQFYKR